MQQPAYPSEIFSAWDGQTVHRSEPETHCGFSFENGRNFGPMEADRQEALASQNLKEIDLKHADEESTSADEEPSSSPLDAVSIHPRRKAGEPRLERGQKRESVLLTKKYLLSCFGLPMPYVASKLVSLMLVMMFVAFALIDAGERRAFGVHADLRLLFGNNRDLDLRH